VKWDGNDGKSNVETFVHGTDWSRIDLNGHACLVVPYWC
jgi:hypothetical protein